jgi:hypothetical protein
MKLTRDDLLHFNLLVDLQRTLRDLQTIVDEHDDCDSDLCYEARGLFYTLEIFESCVQCNAPHHLMSALGKVETAFLMPELDPDDEVPPPEPEPKPAIVEARPGPKFYWQA